MKSRPVEKIFLVLSMCLLLYSIIRFTWKPELILSRAVSGSFLESSEKSLCGKLENTSLDGETILLIRFLGANLFSMQSPQQINLNLADILKNEISLSESSDCVKKLWIIGCSYNATEISNLENLLISYDQLFYNVPRCTENNSTDQFSKYMYQINTARNFGIQKAMSIKPTPAWVFPLDGDLFLSRDSTSRLINSLITATSRGEQYFYIPRYRLLRCQKTIISDAFDYRNESATFKLTNVTGLPTLSDHLSDQSENQIGFSAKVENILELLNTNWTNNKAFLLERLKNDSLTCGHKAN